MRASLGIAYIVAALVAAVLPFLAFGATGLFVLVPTALWLAPGLRTDAPRSGQLMDGVVGWPGLTALVCSASGFALAALRGRMMAAAWLASCAVCALFELARARLATTDHARAQFRDRS